jgi:hypothetical protein
VKYLSFQVFTMSHFFGKNKEKVHNMFAICTKRRDLCQKFIWFYIAPYTPTILNIKLNIDAFL